MRLTSWLILFLVWSFVWGYSHCGLYSILSGGNEKLEYFQEIRFFSPNFLDTFELKSNVRHIFDLTVLGFKRSWNLPYSMLITPKISVTFLLLPLAIAFLSHPKLRIRFSNRHSTSPVMTA